MTTPVHLLPKVRSDKIMASAMGQPCALRIASFVPGSRCSGEATVVGAHAPVAGKGMSTKVTDMAVVFACYACHAILDGADHKGSSYIKEHYPAAMLDRVLNGLIETHARLIEDGVIVIPDAEFV